MTASACRTKPSAENPFSLDRLVKACVEVDGWGDGGPVLRFLDAEVQEGHNSFLVRAVPHWEVRQGTWACGKSAPFMGSA